MHVWLITIGEPLPFPEADVRLLRTGRLAGRLAASGHRVTWWSSDFDHTAKRQVAVPTPEMKVGPNLEVVLLHGAPYRRNVSSARLLNHWQVGRAFRKRAPGRARPDVILCSFPTIELAVAATQVGAQLGAAVVLDVRDLWPDSFVGAVPPVIRPLARVALAPYFRAARRALAAADGIVAISEGYLAWALGQAGRSRGPRDAVIPLGYTPTEPDPASERAWPVHLPAFDPARRIVWFVGSFGRTYDLAPVIATARAFWAAGRRDLQFVLSGAGEREAEWRRLADGVPNLVFTGWLDRQEIQVMLRLAYLGLASYAVGAPQGLPNKLFEYLSAGVPVVSSLRGEAKALLDETGSGVTYDPREPGGLMRIIAELVDQPSARDRLSRNALATFRSRFSAEWIDDQLVSYLESLAQGRWASDRVAGTRVD